MNSQWATFLQTLFSIAARRPRTVVILTLPSEQDANRKLTGELKQFIPTVLETVDELEKTAARQTRNLTPTQSYERAAVLARRLFDTVDTSHAAEVARAYMAYYEVQRDAGVPIDSRAFEPDFAEQIRVGYPFIPNSSGSSLSGWPISLSSRPRVAPSAWWRGRFGACGIADEPSKEPCCCNRSMLT